MSPNTFIPGSLMSEPEPMSTAVVRTTVQTWLRWADSNGYSRVAASAFLRALVDAECSRHERGEQ